MFILFQYLRLENALFFKDSLSTEVSTRDVGRGMSARKLGFYLAIVISDGHHELGR